MRFSQFRVLLVFFLAAGSAALGQVTVEIDSDRTQFLAHEKLELKVKVTNFSSRALTFGQEEQWLTFNVESSDGFIVNVLGQPPVKGEFTLQNATVGTKRVDIEPYFSLAKSGRYRVVATVQVPELKAVVRSEPYDIYIVGGSEIWKQDFGLSMLDEREKEVQEVRSYALVQVTQLRQIILYVRVMGANGNRTLAVFPLGNMVSFSQPVPQMDRNSNLHVLYQSGARTYSYFVVNPNGKLLVRQIHQITSSRPVLRPDPEGRIRVVGGARILTKGDLPVPRDAFPSLFEGEEEEPAAKEEEKEEA